MIKFQDVTNAPYHEKQIAYYTKHLDDPSGEQQPHLHFAPTQAGTKPQVDPLIPRCYGKLAQQHKREGTTYTVEEWRIVSMGYNPFEKDWHKHPLKANATKLDKNLKPIPKAIKKLADEEKKKKEKKDRDSLEFVLSSDKSISVWWAAQDKATQDRYLTGVNKIMERKILPLLDRFAMYEQNNRKLFASGLGFVSWFNHIESRAVDPFLHVHFNIKSNVEGLDGKYHALASDAITKNVALIDAAWQLAQSRMLREEFGLELTATATKVDDRNDYLAEDEKNLFAFGVAGVAPELCEAFSKRSREIGEQVKKLGLDPSSHEAVELAQVSSRSQKTELNATALRDGWRKELAEEWNYTAEVANQLAKAPQEPRRIPTDAELMESFERRHMDVEFTESTFKAHVFRQLMLVQSEDVIERRAEELFMKEARAVYGLGKQNPYEAIDASTNPEERRALQHHLNLTATYTARHFLDRENFTIAGIEARKDETSHVLDKASVIKAMDEYQERNSTTTRKFKFNAGQINAVLACTTDKGGCVSVEGMAGAGKTAVVKCLKERYEASGYQVIGTATAAKATSGLRKEADIRNGGNTSEILLKLKGMNGKPPTLTLTNKHVVILDEAGMSSGREICAIADYVNKAGAKLICLGDSDQLQAVGASGLWRHIANRFTSVKLTEIQRQREDWAREMVSDMAGGRSFEAVMSLHAHGGIAVYETTEERVKALARDYLADPSDPQRKFIVASLNADANMLNQEVQRQQLEAGLLKKDLGVAVVEDRDGFVRRFHVGERIVFDKKTKNMDPTLFNKADNAATGTVAHMVHNRKTGELRALTVELDNGETLTLDKQTVKNMKLGSALTTHKSQGDTVINSYIFASNKLANLHTAYVQLSRHKENTKLYLSKDQVNTIAEDARLAEPAPAQQSWALDLIAKDLARNVIDEEKAKSLREDCQTFQGCREYLNSHSEAWKAEATVPRQKLMQTQTLRDFVSLFESYGKANHKKATLDLNLLSEDHQARAHELRRMLNSTQRSKPLEMVQPKEVALPVQPEVQKRKPAISMRM